MLNISGMLKASGCQPRLYRPRYDRDRLATPEGRERLGQVLNSFPQPSWDTDVDQHCRLFEDHIQKELDAHFTVPLQKARATYP